MPKFVTPIIVVSKCLEFDACRYNGQMIHDDFVRNLQKHVHFIPICPEYEIGLGIPRDPIRVLQMKEQFTLIQPSTGRDLTDEMNQFASKHLNSLTEVDGFILKSRSPSCGIGDVKLYSEQNEQTPIGYGSGLYARAVLSSFPYVAVEDEQRLKQQHIRDHFLTKLYLLASFRLVKHTQDLKQLNQFLKNNTYLLQIYDRNKTKEMQQILASSQNTSFDEVILLFEKWLFLSLQKLPSFSNLIQTITDLIDKNLQELNRQEKDAVLQCWEKYRQGVVPLHTPLTLLRSYITRYNQANLAEQTLLEPFPQDLV